MCPFHIYCKLKTFTPKRKRECPFKNGHFILSLHNSQCFFREAVKQKKKRQRSSKAEIKAEKAAKFAEQKKAVIDAGGKTVSGIKSLIEKRGQKTDSPNIEDVL